MSIIAKLREQLLNARKSQNSKNVVILSTLVGDLQANAKLIEGQKVISDEDATSLIKKYIKGLDENLKVKPDNKDALYEKQYLENFLPKQLTEDELSVIVQNSGLDNFGSIMKYLKENYSNQYDGKLASQVARNYVVE